MDAPHLSFPFRRTAQGKVALVEQDTDAHVLSCVKVILNCPIGFRVDRPEFGWEFPVFHTFPLDTEPLEEALREFEPRAAANAVEYQAIGQDAITRQIDVEV